jgi:hypothetical protein
MVSLWGRLMRHISSVNAQMKIVRRKVPAIRTPRETFED